MNLDEDSIYDYISENYGICSFKCKYRDTKNFCKDIIRTNKPNDATCYGHTMIVMAPTICFGIPDNFYKELCENIYGLC